MVCIYLPCLKNEEKNGISLTSVIRDCCCHLIYTVKENARNVVRSFWNRISVSWRILKRWKFIPSEMWGKMIMLEFSAWHFLGKVIQMHLNLVFWRINSKCPIWMKVSFHINIKTSSATEENCWWRIKIGWIFSEKKKWGNNLLKSIFSLEICDLNKAMIPVRKKPFQKHAWWLNSNSLPFWKCWFWSGYTLPLKLAEIPVH